MYLLFLTEEYIYIIDLQESSTFNNRLYVLFHFSIVFRDDGCSGKTGVAGFVDLVTKENVDVVVGPVCSSGELLHTTLFILEHKMM